jgi:hypothetical protein
LPEFQFIALSTDRFVVWGLSLAVVSTPLIKCFEATVSVQYFLWFTSFFANAFFFETSIAIV